MSRIGVFWNSVSTILLFATNAVIGFVMAPMLVSHLGAESFGLWEVMLGLVGYLGLLDLGISPAVIRFLAVARGSGDHARLQKIFSASLSFFLLLAALGTTALWIVAINPASVFATVAERNVELRTVLLIFSLNFIFSYAQMAVLCFLLGAQQYRTVNSLRLVSQVAQAVIVYSIFTRTSHGSLITLVLVSVNFVLLEGIILAIVLKRREPTLHFKPSADKPLVRELFGFGAKSVTITAAATIMKSGVPIVIAHTAGVAQIVFFVFPARIVEYSQGLSNAIGIPLTPYLAHAFGKGGTDAARSAWEASTRALHFVGFGLAMGIAWLGLPFIGRWMGPTYAAVGAPVFVALCCGMVAQTLSMNCSRVIISMNMHGLVAKIMLVLGIVCLSIAYPLTLHFGIVGAAIGAATFIAAQSFIEMRLACKYLGLRARDHLRSMALRYLLPVVAGSAALYVMRQVVLPDSYPTIALHALFGGLAYATTAVITALDSTERGAVRQELRTRFGST